MSDYNSSLPVRTENNGDIAAFIADGTTPSQLLAIDAAGKVGVKLSDGAGTALTSTNNGGKQSLDVNVTSTIAVGQTDKSAFTYGTTSETPVGGVYQDASPSLVAGTTGAVRLTQFRAFHVNLRDAAGNQMGDSNADGLWVRPGDGTNVQLYTASGEAKVSITEPLPAGTNAIGTVTDSNFPTTVDTNYGTVGANTIRTASQIGNATGAANFNYGAVGAQTLRTASQIGNATGAADFNAGATGAQTLRVVANQGAPNTNANGWFVRITDGTNNQTVTAGGAATVTANNFPATVDTNYGTVGANTIRTASQIGNATGAADFNNGATGAQTLRVAANLAIGGANVTNANPVPVTIEATPGTHVNDYKDAASVAANATDNHDYTVTAGKTLHLNQLEGSASGKAKMVVQVETGVATGVFTSYWTQFNSTADSNFSIRLMDDISVAAGVRVRLVMTNRDNQAQDLYSTISGFEL